MVRRTFQERFEYDYGKSASAEELYLAQPWVFTRFARLCPRPAYLLGHLRTFYTDLEMILNMFVAEYCRLKSCLRGTEPRDLEDEFDYFSIGDDYYCILLHLRAALCANDKAREPLVYEIAQDLLDTWDDPDRRAIVDELLSADLAAELDKRVGHTSEEGFWKARKAIARTETIFSRNSRYIRDRIGRNSKEVATPSPLGGKWSLTPSSSTINNQDAESSSSDGKVGFEKDPFCE